MAFDTYEIRHNSCICLELLDIKEQDTKFCCCEAIIYYDILCIYACAFLIHICINCSAWSKLMLSTKIGLTPRPRIIKYGGDGL